ncbi:hypothetical protein [Wenjunlia tyrosinilytica]|uniref:Uncharacterized protein n=1 Tax=Wenjunlia tyrosinilytica TaxID=1544741 RepID=A0A917ZPY2_9ACTN|nr:hypothetical protein [Wenjunlia tyrosinilytica]GGO86921.1 hypothetical protein GCM10012280_24190 [Wenjunlia tyrosinilytica]
MHHHGYLWLGDKARFDTESIRRPAPGVEPAPTSPPEVVERYRQAVGEFPVSEVPPIESAFWLLKPSRLIRGTWEEPKEAAQWLSRQLTEYAPRFSSEYDQDRSRLELHVTSATERLTWGGDVTLGFYLGQAQFLSLSVVTCSPNRAAPELACPAR